ncbi:MAG: metalloregulator ArsR/SmtB family transcription factor [Leptospirales bacterium]|jgi:DNA-binding transcriptional ArsR family regulator
MVVESVDALSATFAALGDPTRRSILGRLASGPATVGELCEPFAMSQQAISKHLAYLERARLIHKRPEGRRQVCSLRTEAIKAVADWADEYRRLWEQSFDRLEDYLAKLQAAGDEPQAARTRPPAVTVPAKKKSKTEKAKKKTTKR